MRQIITANWARISKNQARARYMAGQDLYVLPCNMDPESPWPTMHPVQHTEFTAESWESFLSAFCYYNCHNGLGRYPAFYVRREECDAKQV